MTKTVTQLPAPAAPTVEEYLIDELFHGGILYGPGTSTPLGLLSGVSAPKKKTDEEAVRAEPDSHKRRRAQMYLKGFKHARDLAVQVVETVDTTDRSLLANALRAIHPPTKVRQKPEDKP